MYLGEIAEKVQMEEQVEAGSTLPASCPVCEVTEQRLAACGETIYLLDQNGTCDRKIKKELLEYLLHQRRERLYLQMLDHVQDGIIAVDQDGRIFYLNPAYTDSLKVKPHKIIGRYIQQVEPNSLLTRVLKTRRPVESASQRIASIDRYVSLRILPIYVQGEFAGAVSIFRDVTELHELNQEVRKMTSIVGEYSRQLSDLSALRNMGILTQDRAYLSTLDEAVVVARTDVPILIRGENGVGKEVLANYIHQCSARKSAPLITVNCAAIPAELLESELFGYEAGAFTGAVKGGKKGKFELADKGTIFLDEIGDMPLAMQAKLLRVIQSGEIEKLGRQRDIRVNVRILAATNQPLEQLIAEKQFRQDLFFRLNVFTLRIPPLRERPGDIVLLANHFVAHFNRKYQKEMKLSSAAYAYLRTQNWPGNVRELQGCIERAVILEDERFLSEKTAVRTTEIPAEEFSPWEGSGLREQIWRYEGELLRRTLEKAQGNRTAAMEQLGLSRRTFYRKCAEHGLFKKEKCQN